MAAMLSSSNHVLDTPATSTPAGGATALPTTVAISASANPILTSRGVGLTGRVTPEVTPSTGQHPTGIVTWTVTSATGHSVPCAFGVTTLDQAGNVWCKIAPHELWAADGPYTVTLSYPGDQAFAASAQTGTLAVSTARSRTKLAVARAASSDSSASLTAKVTGVPSRSGTPTGRVTFAVSGSSAPVHCAGGTNTLTLSSGVATCSVSSAPTTSGPPVTVQATYSGDGNFKKSVSAPKLTALEQPSSTGTTTTPTDDPTTTTTTPPTTTTTPPTTPTPTPKPTPTPTPTTVAPLSGAMPPPPGYSNQQLIFDDQFRGTTLDTSKWTPEMAGQGSAGWWSGYNWGAGNDYTATGTATHQTFFDPARVVVDNGLSITMSYDPTYAAAGWTTRSGCISTYNKFTFTSGYVQVSAEMPDSSSGQWPAIWLLPNGAPVGGAEGAEEIDMEEGGFLPDETGMPSNTPVNSNFAPNYHNPNGTQTLSPAGAVSSSPLDTSYHTYGMELIAGKSVKFYLDGQFVTEQSIGVTTEPWEIVIWNAFATSNTSGYHTVGNPSSLSPSTLRVAEVQVYS
jgi:hypothetical protein